MSEYFAPGVHAAVVGQDLVLLDLNSDAYSCLPDIGADTPAGWLKQPDVLAPDVLEALRAGGLVRREARKTVRLSPPPKATSDLRHLSTPRIGLGDLTRGMEAAGDVLRVGRDATVSALIGGRTSRGSADRPDAVAAASASFAAILPWLPLRHQCLHRSAGLRSYLRRQDLSADWVFGVRTWPFRAHCWLQLGEVCLNDDHERLRAYTPILVVRSGS